MSLARQEVLHGILKHVNAVGWENACWSDDNLSTKKLYPGFQFAGKQQWTSRLRQVSLFFVEGLSKTLRTTHESMALAVTHLQETQQKKPVKGRKPDTATVEEISQRAAVCWHLGQELLQLAPVPVDKLNAYWYNNFATGEGAVDSEIQALLLDKAASLNLKLDVPTFRRLVEDLHLAMPVTNSIEADGSLTVDKFALLKKQMDYDVQVFETWRKKCASLHVAAAQAKHEWRLQRRKRCQFAAQTFLQVNLRLFVWDRKKAEEAIACVMHVKRELQQKHGFAAEDLWTLVWHNASAPCLVPQAIWQQQVQLMAWLLNDQMKSMGLVLMPVFTHQRGKLSLEEQSLISKLMQAGLLNTDWSFHVMFKDKSDARDLRPMVYSGKFIFASPLELSKRLGRTRRQASSLAQA